MEELQQARLFDKRVAEAEEAQRIAAALELEKANAGPR